MKIPRQKTLFDDSADPDGPIVPGDAHGLVSLALALGAEEVPGWSEAERRLCAALPAVSDARVDRVRRAIREGEDPLGEAFCALRSPADRRPRGATFTPAPIVEAMLGYVKDLKPARIVDPGVGSGRFAVRAGQLFREASILGIEIDPLPAILARANLAAAGLQRRSAVVLADYRFASIPRISGQTLFIGNPPYVRHHLIDAAGKRWLTEQAAALGLNASQLSGLHVHFFLATAAKASAGDCGVFITAAEWLEVNYGKLVRELFLGPLGGKQIVVVEPQALPFPDAATTAAVVSFEAGTRPTTVRLKRATQVSDLATPGGGRLIRRERLETESRWSHLTRLSRKAPSGYVELGEICRVHRGQVTGANKVWIAGPHSAGLPDSVLFPSVTKARELFRAGPVLDDSSALRRVIDLPVALDGFSGSEKNAINRFLAVAKTLHIHEMYVAANRRAWWSVGLRKPAPILATYMARRPPAFVRNLAGARHLNIAHGLYPREPFGEAVLANLVEHLSSGIALTDGRTYAGGLTKFEPREMERILVPSPELLAQGVACERSASLDARGASDGA